MYLPLRSTTTKVFTQQKYYFETLQTMEKLLLKALREVSNDLDKFKLETQIKTFKNIVDEKQDGIKEAIKIILSLYASRKLIVSEVLKLVKTRH